MEPSAEVGYRLAFPSFLPMFQPQARSCLTMRGVTATVNGIRTKMKLLWMAYASASCVAKPINISGVSDFSSSWLARSVNEADWDRLTGVVAGPLLSFLNTPSLYRGLRCCIFLALEDAHDGRPGAGEALLDGFRNKRSYRGHHLVLHVGCCAQD